MIRHRCVTFLLVGVDAGLLGFLQPHPVRLVARLGNPRAWLVQTPDAALADVSRTLLWLLAAWLGLGIVATLFTRLPGMLGRMCSATSRRLLPGTLRRLVAGSLGLSVALTPVSFASPPGRVRGRRPPSSCRRRSGPEQTRARRRALVRPPHSSPSAPTPARADRADRRPVVVRPGDSLWLIAARRLGPTATDGEVAGAWPRWYAANRQLIGDDPELIRPGQRLDPPRNGAQS